MESFGKDKLARLEHTPHSVNETPWPTASHLFGTKMGWCGRQCVASKRVRGLPEAMSRADAGDGSDLGDAEDLLAELCA